MSKSVVGFFLDEEGVRHITSGSYDPATWTNPYAPTVNWLQWSWCSLAPTSKGTALSTAVRQPTCLMCIAISLWTDR